MVSISIEHGTSLYRAQFLQRQGMEIQKLQAISNFDAQLSQREKDIKREIRYISGLL